MDSSQRGDYPAARLIWTVVPPIVALVGILGNITTILVFTRKQKPTSTTIYMTWVAVADLMVLAVVYPRWWIIYVFSTDIRRWNNIVCKVHIFLSYTTGYMSTYILTAVTVERIISVSKPYKSKLICTFGSAMRVSVVLLIINLCINGHVIYGFSLVDGMPISGNSSSNISNASDTSVTEENYAHQQKCDWTRYDRYAYFYTHIHDAVVAMCQVVVLQVIFVVGGAIVVWEVMLSQRLHFRMTNSAGKPNNAPLPMTKKSRQITITVLLIVLVYLLCTIPVVIFLGLRHRFVVHNRMTEVQAILWAVFNQLFYVNHAVNFFLFAITGESFRQDVKELFYSKTSRNMAVAVVSDSLQTTLHEDTCNSRLNRSTAY